MIVPLLTTFGTYMLADYLSGWLEHPTQKMDYGVLNPILGFGREIDQKFWGTRTEHIVGVAGALALTDHASQYLFNRNFKKAGLTLASGRPLTLSYANTPDQFLKHTFGFIAAGVGLYCVADAVLNPLYEGQSRGDVLKKNLYGTVRGSATSWIEPLIAKVLTSLPFFAAGGPLGAAGVWLAASLIPATITYAAVKGFGWNDFGDGGLNDYEKEMENLKPDHVPSWVV